LSLLGGALLGQKKYAGPQIGCQELISGTLM
jgi:hypothetical protein